jgi:hypothetical protein
MPIEDRPTGPAFMAGPGVGERARTAMGEPACTRIPNVWPPVLTWTEPIAYDANGVIHEATREWLDARWGADTSTGMAPRARAADPSCSDAELDVILARAGYERAPNPLSV